MKIYKGKPRVSLTPWKVSRFLLFFLNKDSDYIDKLGDILAYGKVVPTDNENRSFTLEEFTEYTNSLTSYKKTIFFKFLDKLNREPLDYIHIDSYDVWNMDTTLISIIYPLLLEYKKQKNGSPSTDNEDVPEHLRNTSTNPLEDSTIHERWNYILEEMLYAFSPEVLEKDYNLELSKEEIERVNKGHQLFGKYLRGMWT